MSDLTRTGDGPEAQVLARMEAARQQLAAAKTVGDAKGVADAAAAVCEWLRRQTAVGLEIVNDARLLQMQAEKRMGEFLKQPGAVKSDGRPAKPSIEMTVSAPTHADLGIKRQTAQQYRQVAEVPEETLQELAEKATKAGREFTRKSVLRAVSRTKPMQPAEEVPVPPAGFENILNAVTTGDARELSRLIPDNSIALCLCDPVYERIEDYAWLARECERVLVDGGNLIVQCGNLRRFQAETALRQSSLTYVDLLAEVYPYALCPLFPIRVQVGWKPYLWFSKGPRVGGWVMNRLAVGGKTYSDASKELHPWGDSEQFSAGLLTKLCEPGEVVWDPFTGSGTVPLVAKKLGLPFVAFEIEPESADKARQRVAGTLRSETPRDQMSLWDEEPAAVH